MIVLVSILSWKYNCDGSLNCDELLDIIDLFIYGDVNCDGSVNEVDAQIMGRICIHKWFICKYPTGQTASKL